MADQSISEMSQLQHVWVFNGPQSSFPAGVFSSRTNAEVWIVKHRLSGTLTSYPLDIGAYDWAIARGYFNATREDQREASFIQRFTTATQEHYHYKDGQLG